MTLRRTWHSLWNGATPVQQNIDSGTIETIALAFVPTQHGQLGAVKYYRQAADGENHLWWLIHVHISNSAAYVEAAGTFVRNLSTGRPAGWETNWFHPFLTVEPNALYQLVVWFNAGKYSNMVAAHTPDTDTVVGPLTIPRAGGSVVTNNGLKGTTLTLFPGTAIGNAKPALDVYFHQDGEM